MLNIPSKLEEEAVMIKNTVKCVLNVMIKAHFSSLVVFVCLFLSWTHMISAMEQFLVMDTNQTSVLEHQHV